MAPKKKAAKTSKRAAKATKEETVDVSTGVQLLLGNMIGEKDRSYYYQTYLNLLAKKAHIGSQIQEFGKKAKEAGVDMAALKLVISMEKWESLDLATYLKQLAANMRDRGLPLQMNLYQPQYGTVQEQATAMGWADGKSGRSPATDLWPEKTPGHEEYMRAWNDGQKQIIEDGQKNKGKQPDPDFDE